MNGIIVGGCSAGSGSVHIDSAIRMLYWPHNVIDQMGWLARFLASRDAELGRGGRAPPGAQTSERRQSSRNTRLLVVFGSSLLNTTMDRSQ